MTQDWKIFTGKDAEQTDRLYDLPPAPPWRFAGRNSQLSRPAGLDLASEKKRADPFIPTEPMRMAVNAALYLRRPLLLTGRPGTGKSTLISKVAYELRLGSVIRWPISSKSTVKGGIYEYDAVGRLQASKTKDPPVEDFLRLGPLGTALMGQTWPRPLLIDEIDKSDLDFANDLLNVIEEGTYEIPELVRLKPKPTTARSRKRGTNAHEVRVRDYFGDLVTIADGRIVCGEFPFVVITSNAERDFPAPFLRRCIRLNVTQPSETQLADIVESQLGKYEDEDRTNKRRHLIQEFAERLAKNEDLATDQLLNAMFLTVSLADGTRSFNKEELEQLKQNLLRSLTAS
ncbi:AAA family ATPase [Bradyrhizobium sp. SEMIA]|uniref:AAA family ATPase n=1 Tax=Bradyrhizobium sp. SEMIA TaxID=2597515 RepID=UPI0018A59D9E|nr:MoxR family ATPase [Bradyrhizobium sp. SEMIA]QOG17735.1 AAA domain-containing protein [Bradyrhizobium sp. SEMIA]